MVGWGIFWVACPAYIVAALLYATATRRGTKGAAHV
jgi:hypothetical protein